MKKVRILGCEFNAWSTAHTLEQIQKLIKDNKRDYLCTVNISILMMMRSNHRLKTFIEKSNMVVADGQPIIWTSRYIKNPLPERVTGVELVTELANIAQKNNWGIYLMGATKEVVSAVVENLSKEYPELIISGYDDGYLDRSSYQKRAETIKSSGAKILIVAMGVPRQEEFIEESWKNLGVNFAVGVGGSFDVIAGITKRAPLWMQKTGLEWLFRTLQEPRRLFMRYLTTNTKFIYLFIREIVFSRKAK